MEFHTLEEIKSYDWSRGVYDLEAQEAVEDFVADDAHPIEDRGEAWRWTDSILFGVEFTGSYEEAVRAARQMIRER